MRFRTNSGLGNPLLRRVRRHAAMTTIFRAADAIPVRETPRGTWSLAGSSARTGIVQATLIPVSQPAHPEFGTDNLPLARQEPTPLGPPTPQVPEASTRLASPPPSKPKRLEAGAPSQEEPESENRLWERLKTIFRAHQEKETSAESPSSPSEPPETSVQTKIDPHLPISGKQRVHPMDGPEPEPEPRPSRMPAQNQTSDRWNPNGMPAVPGRDLTAQKPGIPDHTLGQEIVESPVETSVQKESLEPEPSQKPDSDSPTGLPQTPPTLRETGAQTASKEKQSPPEANSEAQPPLQKLPIEAVWPVQRRVKSPEVPEATENPDLYAPEPQPPMSPPEPEDLPDPDVASIHRALIEITPGRPTDSSVEIITPRRPRPQSRPMTRATPEKNVETLQPEPAEIPQQAAAGKPTPPSGTREAESLTKEHPGAKPLVSPDFSLEPQHDSTALQRQPEKDFHGRDLAQREPPPPEIDTTGTTQTIALESGTDPHKTMEISLPDHVQTEIGPLPRDLWSLLGQTPPEHPENELASPTTEPTRKDVSSAITGIAASDTRESLTTKSPSPVISQRRESEPPVVQRTVEQVRSEPTRQSEARRVEETENAEAGHPQVDINDLARQVFAEVKRRLAVEWERGRQRL